MGENRKQKNVLRFVVIFSVFLFGLITENVFADDDGIIDVTGGGTGGGTTDCNFPQGFQNICKYGDNRYEGGASWHVYKIGDNVKPNNSVADSGGILVDDPNNPNDDIPTEASINAKCKSEMSDWDGWYAAYGWDGRIKGLGSGYAHWGPAQWNTGVIAGAYYNYHGGISFDEFKKRAANGTLTSGTKLYGTTSAKNSVAEMLHGGAIPANVGAFCVSSSFFGSTFSGLSRVSESTAAYGDVANNKKKSTGWQQTDKTVFHIMNCDNANGCSAKISHYLVRLTGNKSTEYSLSRITNIDNLDNISGGHVENFSGIDNGDGKRVLSTNFTNVVPGQYVCETMTFGTNSNGGTAKTAACLYVKGSRGSDIGIDVKNAALSTGWVKSVYAKPGDAISLKGWYNPSYQYAKDLFVNNTVVGSCNKGKNFVGSAFNSCVNPGWNNAFSINLNGTSFNTINVSGTIGKSSSYSKEVNNAYSVKANDVGKNIEAKAATNTSGILTTPKSVSFDVDSSRNIKATVNKDAISASANIVVPYNYENTTSIAASDDAVVYAGESTSINFNVTVGKKWNNLTKGSYATVVPNGKWKLEVCDERRTWCKETDATTGELNTGGNLDGDSFSKNITINVPDWSAGTKICVRSAVYPANSGSDNSLDKNGSNSWRYSSESACYTVAKKPSFQVWGGNIYSARSITTSVAGKTNVAGHSDYNVNNKSSNRRYVFGSWGELGVIATSKVKGLASGAGTGYSGMNLDANPGGSAEVKMNYCNRATLSFANVDCDGADAFTGDIQSGNAMSTAIGDKGDILRKLIEGNNTVNVLDSYVDLSAADESKITEKGIYHYNGGKNDLIIGEAKIDYGKKIVVHTEGDITISGNLRHYGEDTYSSLYDVSKLIIYGNNVKISCDVSRVDALIVADNEVNTCVDNDGNTPNINSRLRSNQLRINGAIITGKVKMNRTYGAATGNNSIAPAEIINFDSTFYLWGARESSIAESGKISTISITELPPRY